MPAISWCLHLSVNDGRLDDFRTLMREMVKATKADEPGALAYEWFVSDDGTAVNIYERYADNAAALTHMGNFGAKYAERFMSMVGINSLTVYGEPSPELREVMAGAGAAFMAPFGGFAR